MNYNKKDIYNDKIKKHLTEIRHECVLNNIPFFFAFCLENDENGSKYKYDMYSAMETSIQPTTNYFPEFVKVMCGMKANVQRPEVVIADETGDSILDGFEGDLDNNE